MKFQNGDGLMSISTDILGYALEPFHLSCRPSKVEPKKGAPPGILHASDVRPRYRDETCPEMNKASFPIRGFGQSSRLDPAGGRLYLNSRKGVSAAESWNVKRMLASFIQKLRAER